MSPLALSIRFLQTQPDAKLVELARAGHERAFEALVQRYRRPLLSYCRRISGTEAAAEDALQQGLLQAWVALSSGEIEVRDARAWLYRIVHNVMVSNLRRPVHDPVEVDRTDSAGGADHEVEQRLAVRQALAGLASLPELQRQVMLSAALEGQSHNEIAATLGLSHGAVRGLIYRARATLRAAAAAVTPTPLVRWAARQELASGGRSAGIYEAVAGGGSAGLGGLLIKGGAVVVTAGALATAAGVTSGGRHSHHLHRHALTVAVRPSHGVAASGAAQVVSAPVQGLELTAATSRSGPSHASARGAGAASRYGAAASLGHSGASSAERVISISRTGPSGGNGSAAGSGGDHHGGTTHSGSGGSGSSSGTSGHDRTGGSDGGSQNGSSGGSGSTSGTAGGNLSDGGHDGAVQSSAPTTTSGSGSGSGDGSGDHHDGSGSGSGSGSTTTTVTVTTTSASAGGGGSGGD